MIHKLLRKIDLKELLEHLPTGVVIHAMDTKIVFANKTALKTLQLTWNQIIGKDALDEEWSFIDEQGNTLEYEDYPVNKVINSNEEISDYIIGIRFKENVTWVLVNAYINHFEKESYIVVTFTDITQTHNISFKEIVDNAKDAVVVTEAFPINDPDGPKITYVNDAFCKISEYEREELLGNTPRILQTEETSREALDNIKSALTKKEPIRETLLNFSKSNKPYWLDVSIFPLHGYGNRITHFAAIERDITNLKESELASIQASITDPLTSLSNRRGFDILVQKTFNLKNMPYCIVSIDIDNFKNINDTYGHDTGDEVLKLLSNTILELSRKNDVCCRFGGEEFILFIPDINMEQCTSFAQRIREKASQIEIKHEDTIFTFTISIGIAFSKIKNDLQQTIKQSDLALYDAKKNGKNQVKIYEKVNK